MVAVKQRALVRVATTRKKVEKGKEGASSSTPKVVGKGVPKRKADRKDDHPSKKASITPGEKHPKKPWPPKAMRTLRMPRPS